METLEVGKRFDPLAWFVSKAALFATLSTECDEDFSDFVTAAPVSSTEIEVWKSPETTPQAAPVAAKLASALPAPPSSLEREALEVWARSYCRALCETYQSHRLYMKLFGRPENPEGGSLKFQIKAIPEKMEARRDWLSSAKLSFDKKIGA